MHACLRVANPNPKKKCLTCFSLSRVCMCVAICPSRMQIVAADPLSEPQRLQSNRQDWGRAAVPGVQCRGAAPSTATKEIQFLWLVFMFSRERKGFAGGGRWRNRSRQPRAENVDDSPVAYLRPRRARSLSLSLCRSHHCILTAHSRVYVHAFPRCMSSSRGPACLAYLLGYFLLAR